MYTGRGKYGKNWIRHAAGTVGTLLKRKKFGSDLYDVTAGAALNEMEFANSLTPAGLMGHGAYYGRGNYAGGNNLILGGGSNGTASISSLHDETGAVTISHTEYLTDIFGPPIGQPFQNLVFPLNPALQQTFPFLSQLACNYDEYSFISLIFMYKSTTTDIGTSTTGQCGTVIMCTNYNASGAPFQDKGLMMQYSDAASAKTTDNLDHGVECDPTKNAGNAIQYTRSGPVSGTQDIKTYDLGNFQFAIANSPAGFANNPIGELWVQYRVQLRKPKLFVTRGLAIDKDQFIADAATGAVAQAGINVFGTSINGVYSAQQNNIGCLLQPSYTFAYTGLGTPAQTATVGTGFSITFPAFYNGNLRITLLIAGTVIVPGGWGPVLLGNIVLINDIYSSTTADPASFVRMVGDSGAGAATEFYYVLDIYVKQATGIAYNTASATYSGGNNIISLPTLPATTITSCSLQIDQYQALGGQPGLTATINRILWVNSNGILAVP